MKVNQNNFISSKVSHSFKKIINKNKRIDLINRNKEFSLGIKNKKFIIEKSAALPQNLKSFEEYMEVKPISSRKSATNKKYRWNSANRQPGVENVKITSGSDRQYFRTDLRNSVPSKIELSQNSNQ